MYNKLSMSKLVIEVEMKTPLKNNDVIRYNEEKKKFEVVSYITFNNDLYQERNKLYKKIKDLKSEKDNEINEIKKELKLHKDALKILTKGDL